MTFLRRTTRHIAGVVLGLGLAACSGTEATQSAEPPPPPPPTDRLLVTLTPERDSILFGATRQFTAKVTNQFGADRSATIDWTSTNPSVASVTPNGLVTAVGAGSVQVIASITGSADTSLVTVFGSPAPLQIVPDAISLAVGEDITLRATMGDSVAGAGGEVLWSSSDTTLASVAADGTVTGYSEGEVTLTAKLGESTAQALVTVQAATIASITITPTVNSIPAGSTVQLTAVAKSYTGRVIEGITFNWSSSNTSVASVNAKGLVNGKARGFANISATAQGKRGTVSVNVGPAPVASVVASMPDSAIVIGQAVTATAAAFDSAGHAISGASMSWQSSNPAIATVTSSGVVTGIVTGSVNIMALSGGQIASIPVTVAQRKATSIAITPAAPSVTLGGTTQLTAAILDQNGQVMGGSVTWASAASSIATVSTSGVVTGVAIGQADITASASGLSATARVTVGAATVASVTLSPVAPSEAVGDSLLLTATLKDAAGNVLTGRSLSWATSNPAIATVSGKGLTKGVATGTVTIAATTEGKTGSVTLTVNAAAPLPVGSVTVTLNAGSLSIGQSTQASAAVLNTSGAAVSSPSITWSSADPAIATVSASGLVTAVSGGTTSIVATSGGVSGAASLAVSASAPAPVAKITVILNPGTDPVGATSQASVTLLDSAGNVLTGRTYGMSSDKPAVATVNTAGLVTAVASGLTNIRATSGSVMGYALFNVTSTTPTVASVRVTAPTSAMNVGDTQQAVATALDASGASIGGQSFTWASSDPAVLTVSSTGMLTALAAGSATITATTGGISGTLGFTATAPSLAPVASVSFTVGSPSISVGQTTQGVAVLRDAQGNVLTGRTITYSSSNTASATISSSGLATGVASGSAVLTATSGGVSGSANVSVTQPTVASVSVTLAGSLSVGQSSSAIATVKDAAGNTLAGQVVTWASSSPTVASVNASGVVTALAAGTTTITATSSGISGNASVAVLTPLPAAAANLPRATPVIPAGLETLACTVNVPAGGLQSALNAARGGAVLCLTGSHNGNFTVPARSDAGWVVIRSAGSIPAGRMRPSLAGGLAKLVSGNVLPALQFQARSVRTLVLGLEITAVPTLPAANSPVTLVGVGTGNEATVADLPTDIAFQQLYVHGAPTQHIRRGFTLNGGAQTIRDTWCEEIHAAGFDSQCSVSWNSSGPILIENNTLMAASENIMFGGADPKVPGLVTADITIRKNHITKNITWKGGGWNVKNLIETKSSQRVLVEENVIEGTWMDGQVGYAFVLKSTSQNGGCRPCSSSDWTIRRNLVLNAGAGFSIAGRADQHITGVTDSTNRRFDISENWIGPLNVAPYLGDARSVIFVAENQDVTLRKNSFDAGGLMNSVLFDISGGMFAVRNLTMTGNASARGQYGMFASSTGEGLASWTKAALGASIYSSNAFVGATAAVYPTGTTWYSSLSAAVSAGAGIPRSVVDAGVQGVVVTP